MYNTTIKLRKKKLVNRIIFFFGLLLLAVILLTENNSLTDIVYVSVLFIFLFKFLVMKLYQ